MKCIILFLLCLISNIISKEEEKDIFSEMKNTHFCGADRMNFKIKITSGPDNSTLKKTRRLSTEWTQIRILLVTSQMDYQIQTLNPTLKEKVPLLKEALLKAVDALTKLLNVEQLGGDIFKDDLNDYFFRSNGIYNYPKNLINPKNLDTDFILLVRFEENELPYGVLASAMPILLCHTNRPIVGILTISRSPDYFRLNRVYEYFSIVFLHELTHALGFLEGMFDFFPGGREATLKEITEPKSGVNRTFLITKKLVELAKKYFACDDLIGVEVENQGGKGSSISHWEQRILLGDYMGAIIYQEEMTISEFTLAVLEDSGWFKPNYYTGGLFRFGKNQGCNFLNFDCLDSNHNSRFKNEFFNFEDANSPSCSTGRLSRTYEIVSMYKINDIDKAYQRIIQGEMVYGGPYYTTDYCLVHAKNSLEGYSSYFEGNCKLGNGQYGNNIDYFKGSYSEKFHPNSEIPASYGEQYTSNSFCIMSTLIPNGGNKIFNSIFHPMCYPNYCSDKSLTIQVNDQFIVCPRGGGNVAVEGFEGLLHCPDYNLICTGTVLCNDIFDCIDKKSLPKESYIYDYDVKSTQIYSELDEGETYVAYELSENGVCPIHCQQCEKGGRCKICEDGLRKVEIRKNGEIPIICDSGEVNVETGYYFKDDVYYLCFEGCKTCDEIGSKSEFNKCIECKEDYYIIEGTTNCYDSKKEAPEGYFFNSDLKIFQACYNLCKTCLMGGDDENNMNCESCKDGYEFIEGTTNCNKIVKEEEHSALFYVGITILILASLILVIGIILLILQRSKNKTTSETIENIIN